MIITSICVSAPYVVEMDEKWIGTDFECRTS